MFIGIGIVKWFIGPPIMSGHEKGSGGSFAYGALLFFFISS
jgi:hypothetical protein